MFRYLLIFTIPLLTACNQEVPKQEGKSETIIQQSGLFTLPPVPQKMDFAGQQLILKDEDIRERLDREIMTNAYFQSATNAYLKRSERWFPLIERILKEEGIPEDFKYLAVIESGLVQAVSPAGAQGFWQFMPETAKIYDLEMSDEVDERLNIEKSTHAACAYLKKAYGILGDWLLAAASYNRGLAGVQNDMAWQGTDHYFDTDQNSETGRYVFRLLAVKLIFESPEAYGYDVEKMEMYKPLMTKQIVIEESIPNLAIWANEQGFNFKILQKLNPWLKKNKLTIKDKHYTILLPSQSENLKPYKEYLK